MANVVLNRVEASNLQGFLDRGPLPFAVDKAGLAVCNLSGHTVVEAAQHLDHAFSDDPRLTGIEEHSLDNRLVEEANSLGIHTRLNQGLAQLSPACPGLHQIVKHCGPVVVVAGQWAAEVAEEVDLFQWDAVSRDDDAGGLVKLDLQRSSVE